MNLTIEKNSFKIDPTEIIFEKDSAKKARLIQYLAQKCRVEIFDIIHNLGSGHWGGSASGAEILCALYFHIMNIRPEDPAWAGRDRLVVSKGHAAPMLYAILAHRGYFPVEELKTLRRLNSRLQGHPCMKTTPGVEMSTGALGHGISVALGMALAARQNNKKYWSFVLTGEGCLNEGQSWEALMSAAKFKPSRFALLVDNNKVQLDGNSDDIMPLDSLIDKLMSFNLTVSQKIFDGHDVRDIFESWEWMQEHQESPVAVLYKTHKGKGVSFMEDNHKWHGAPIDMDSWKNGRPELITRLEELEGVATL